MKFNHSIFEIYRLYFSLFIHLQRIYSCMKLQNKKITKRIFLKHVHTLFTTIMLDQYHMHDIRVHQYITPSHEICGS